MSSPVSLCNDISRLATINLITLGFNQYLSNASKGAQGIQSAQSIQSWKHDFLRDAITLIIYHQALKFVHPYVPNINSSDTDMISDFVKSGVLLLAPSLLDQKQIQWQKIGLVLAGVALYHKAIRPVLLKTMQEHGIGFDTGIEDLTETILLLSMTKGTGLALGETLVQLAAIVVYHAYFRY